MAAAPPGVEVLQNWNSRDNPRSPLDTAIDLAAEANQDGHGSGYTA